MNSETIDLGVGVSLTTFERPRARRWRFGGYLHVWGWEIALPLAESRAGVRDHALDSLWELLGDVGEASGELARIIDRGGLG